ncbi:hypothetical protein PZN54_11220 [Staphylococcus capitis]|uniref:hypothetical protein n=1 Tax=Staphylococcus capitis TaxID=29388 RepID=UPI0024810086|nr:hypothetical protein [Staphylococcus capitis]MDH9600717.1 hypothetical protein [Staphylococcus capitis]MDH9624369.1 hypothetical protein [Staphylococcus capitis]
MEQIEPKTDVVVQLSGEEGNVFNLCGKVVKALKRNGYREEADEVAKKLWGQHSYDEAIQLFMRYVVVE